MNRSSQPRYRQRLGVALAGLLLSALAACGDAAQKGPVSPVARVAIESFSFVPARLTVEPGTEVTWTNGDDILHTVTTGTPGKQGVPGVSEGVPGRADGLLDRRLDGEGSTASLTFRHRGTYGYYCSIHAGMTGTVEVR